MTRKKKSPVGPVKAFTLAELLVVIAIMGILASLLLPALSATKGRATTAACLSNFKQFAVASQLYAGDHEDAVLPNRDGPNVPLGEVWVQGWLGLPGPDCTNVLYLLHSLVGPYLRSVGVWRCPSSQGPTISGITMSRVRTVSLNCF